MVECSTVNRKVVSSNLGTSSEPNSLISFILNSYSTLLQGSLSNTSTVQNMKLAQLKRTCTKVSPTLTQLKRSWTTQKQSIQRKLSGLRRATLSECESIPFDVYIVSPKLSQLKQNLDTQKQCTRPREKHESTRRMSIVLE